MTDRRWQPQVWLFSAGLAMVYLASVSVIFVREGEQPSPLVIAVFLPAVLAGLLVGRFWTVAFLAGILAISLVWADVVDEDVPLIALIGGVLAGAAAARAYQHVLASPQESAVSAGCACSPLAAREARPATLPDEGRFRRRARPAALSDRHVPGGLYQPVSSLPARASRGTGSESRWSAMLPIIEGQEVGTAVDIGAGEGYFALKLAAVGVPTIAVESDPRNYRTALYAVRRSGIRKRRSSCAGGHARKRPTVPSSDCVLYLSVWHHFVPSRGLTEATATPTAIWRQTRKVMFFDTGETEMTPDYRLPGMTPDPRSWLAGYLRETCAGSRTEHLGSHRAFDPSGNPCERNLFAVIRTDELP